jgi:hypothetical protein
VCTHIGSVSPHNHGLTGPGPAVFSRTTGCRSRSPAAGAHCDDRNRPLRERRTIVPPRTRSSVPAGARARRRRSGRSAGGNWRRPDDRLAQAQASDSGLAELLLLVRAAVAVSWLRVPFCRQLGTLAETSGRRRLQHSRFWVREPRLGCRVSESRLQRAADVSGSRRRYNVPRERPAPVRSGRSTRTALRPPNPR